MGQINTGYQSILESIYFLIISCYFAFCEARKKKGIMDPPSIEEIINEYQSFIHPLRKQMLGSLVEVPIEVSRNFIDAFKPYNSGEQFKQDFLQPYRGLKRLILSLFALVSSVLISLLSLITMGFILSLLGMGYLMRREYIDSSFVNKVGDVFFRGISWILHSILNIAMGAIEIVSTPLTWFVQIPLRGLITCFKSGVRLQGDKRLESMAKLILMQKFPDEGMSDFYVNVAHQWRKKFIKHVNVKYLYKAAKKSVTAALLVTQSKLRKLLSVAEYNKIFLIHSGKVDFIDGFSFNGNRVGILDVLRMHRAIIMSSGESSVSPALISKNKNPFKILKVTPSDNQQTIDNAFRRKSHKYHPDRQRGNDEKMHLLTQAKEAIDCQRERGYWIQDYKWNELYYDLFGDRRSSEDPSHSLRKKPLLLLENGTEDELMASP